MEAVIQLTLRDPRFRDPGLDSFLGLDPFSWGGAVGMRLHPRCPECGELRKSNDWIAWKRILAHIRKRHPKKAKLWTVKRIHVWNRALRLKAQAQAERKPRSRKAAKA